MYLKGFRAFLNFKLFRKNLKRFSDHFCTYNFQMFQSISEKDLKREMDLFFAAITFNDIHIFF